MAAIDGSHPSTRLGTFVWPRIRWAITWSQLTPERISPPGARRAPVSRLPVWQLWMPPISASSVYSPRRNRSFSRNGRSGSSTLPSSMPRPSPRAHHSPLWKPLPANRTANRTGGSGTPGADATGLAPHTGTDSSHGRAIVTPTPRRNARREMGWGLRFMALLLFDSWRQAASLVSLREPASEAACGYGTSLGVLPAADHCKLRAANDHLHGGRNSPAVPAQLRDHLVEQGLVGKRHRAPQRVAEQPPAEQP